MLLTVPAYHLPSKNIQDIRNDLPLIQILDQHFEPSMGLNFVGDSPKFTPKSLKVESFKLPKHTEVHQTIGHGDEALVIVKPDGLLRNLAIFRGIAHSRVVRAQEKEEHHTQDEGENGNDHHMFDLRNPTKNRFRPIGFESV